jgi:hypothetical protein
MIKDSGKRREFETGATRDIADGKGRCDLLPLGVIGEIIEDNILTLIEQYIRTGDKLNLQTALTAFCAKYTDGDWYDMLLEVSIHYEEGAIKYNERNWEKGIPLHCFIDSGVRHYLKFKRGDTDEPHDRAFLFNILGAIWTHINLPDLIDLPFRKDENNEKMGGI